MWPSERQGNGVKSEHSSPTSLGRNTEFALDQENIEYLIFFRTSDVVAAKSRVSDVREIESK